MCIYIVTKEHAERERGQTSRQTREKGTASGGLRVMILGLHLGISSGETNIIAELWGGEDYTVVTCARTGSPYVFGQDLFAA